MRYTAYFRNLLYLVIFKPSTYIHSQNQNVAQKFCEKE